MGTCDVPKVIKGLLSAAKELGPTDIPDTKRCRYVLKGSVSDGCCLRGLISSDDWPPTPYADATAAVHELAGIADEVARQTRAGELAAELLAELAAAEEARG